MALPVEYGTCRVTGRWVDLQGDPVKGSVLFTARTKRLTAAGSQTVIIPTVYSASLDPNGEIDVLLPATDDPDISPVGFTYSVQEKFPGGATFDIEAPVDGTVDLSTVVEVQAGTGAAIIQGPPGPPGPVPVSIQWTDQTVWGQFTPVILTDDNNHVYDLSVEGTRGVITGVSGGGNDRTIHLLGGVTAADVDVRMEFEISAPGAQCGFVMRASTSQAIAVNNNVVFSGSGTINVAAWEYADGVMLTNDQVAGNTASWRVLAVSGDGATITVQTAAPHMLMPGESVELKNVDPAVDGLRSVVATPTATSFTQTLAVSGSWAGGSFFPATKITRRWLAARLVGPRIMVKQWPAEADEPSWGDPLAVSTDVFPDLLTSGNPPPTSGQIGVIGNHMADTKWAKVADLRITPLD